MYLADSRSRLDQFLGEQFGIRALHLAGEGHRATFHFDLNVSGVELRILGQDFVDLARETLVRPPNAPESAGSRSPVAA